jgi:hypothetical protein
MGRQLRKQEHRPAWRIAMVAHLTRPSQFQAQLALSALVFDVGVGVMLAIEEGLDAPPPHPVGAAVALVISAPLCLLPVFVPWPRLKRFVALLGIVFAAVACDLAWPF